jgi:hypothetical protein
MCAVEAQRCVDCGVEAPELYVAGSPRPDGRRQALGGRRRPALRMEQGFFATRPSSVAVCMMALRSL